MVTCRFVGLRLILTYALAIGPPTANGLHSLSIDTVVARPPVQSAPSDTLIEGRPQHEPAIHHHKASGIRHQASGNRRLKHNEVRDLRAVGHTGDTVKAEASTAEHVDGAANRTASSTSSNSTSFPCTSSNTVFDLGFYDGADSRAYLIGGSCVVGVEADPDLCHAGDFSFQTYVASGQLRLLNFAVAPSGDAASWTTFYRNKCNREWNSFYDSVGCRSCSPPHSVGPQNCDAVQVKSVTCKDILTTYGVPVYLKLDIEGAEPGCFTALTELGRGWLPQYISTEITQIDYMDTLHAVGYGGFKLVRQDVLHNGAASQSGPWGNNAMDCRVGTAWRTYAEARHEMLMILSKSYDAADPCSGGVFPIHSRENNNNQNYIWYDLHATIAPR